MMDKPIQTALASFGMSGQVFHGPSLKVNPGFRVKAVWERSKRLSETLFPEAEIVREYDRLLNDPELELIVVNTPDRLHFEMAKAALLAGKHVVIEKPFTQTSAEAAQLIEIARQQQKLIAVYQNRRWDGDFLTVQQIIRSGVLGRLVEFESQFDRYRNAVAPNTWKEESDIYGGVLYNLGAHMVDQILVLFGKPQAVTAQLQTVRAGSQVNDYYHIRLEYENFSALTRCSYLVREEGPRYIVHGNEGSFLKWGIDPQEEALKKGALPGGPGWGAEPESLWGVINTQLNGLHVKGKIETIPGNYPAFYQNLYEAIRLGKELAVKPEEARLTVEILERCLESNRQKKTLPVL